MQSVRRVLARQALARASAGRPLRVPTAAAARGGLFPAGQYRCFAAESTPTDAAHAAASPDATLVTPEDAASAQAASGETPSTSSTSSPASSASPSGEACKGAGKSVAFSFNGTSLAAREGQTILDAVENYGIGIRADCRVGRCEQCEVHVTIAGEKASVLACQEPVRDGYQVRTPPLQAIVPLLKAPRELADQVCEALEHTCDKLAGDPQALQYDVDGQVKRAYKSLVDKVPARRLEQMSGFHHTLLLEKLGLHDLDAFVLARYFRFMAPREHLRFLNLSGNPLLDEGVQALSEQLIKAGGAPQLRSLFLSNTHVSARGVRSLCADLQAHRSIQILELRNNFGVGDEAAQAIAELIRQNASLRTIFLNGCQVGDLGARALADAVQAAHGRGPKVVDGVVKKEWLKVWLTGNPVSAAMKQRVQQIHNKVVFKF